MKMKLVTLTSLMALARFLCLLGSQQLDPEVLDIRVDPSKQQQWPDLQGSHILKNLDQRETKEMNLLDKTGATSELPR